MRRNDPRAKLSDADFISQFEQLGAIKLARKIGISKRNIWARRASLENRYGVQVRSPNTRNTRQAERHAAVLSFQVENGIALVGSDAHIWPGKPTTAMRAFVAFCKEMRPKLAILNGDVLDFPQVSRHPPIGHLSLPNIAEEIESAQEQLFEIEKATPRSCKLVWPVGNHDLRFETRLAVSAPEYAKLHGHSLKHYFPAWQACWRADINDDVVIKHRHKNGIHATFNSTLWAGKTMVTGHLHSQVVRAFTDYRCTRYGVDTGCLADPRAKAFVDYTEASPLNWRSGFAVLTFKDGYLLPPELVTVHEQKPDHVIFRGEVIRV